MKLSYSWAIRITDFLGDQAEQIHEWRRNTVRAIKLMSSENVEATEVHKLLETFLTPFTRPRADRHRHGAREEYSQDLLRLCNATLNFALLIRSSKDNFEFHMPERSSPLDLNLVSVQGKEVSGRPGEEKIGVVLFAALIKRPAQDRDNRLVLEKAHIIIRAEK